MADRAEPANPQGPDVKVAAQPARVFISYASPDHNVADAVVGELERVGLKCWIVPRDVVPGALYADEIVRAIDEAKVVVLVLSQSAIASPHVGKEVERASSKRRRIVALRMDSAPLTRAFEYFLSESQWIDVGSEGIEAAAVKLADAIRRHVDPSSAADPGVPVDRPVAKRATPFSRKTLLMIGAVAAVPLTLALLIVQQSWLSRHAKTHQPADAAGDN
jgi:hypothetical protein